MQERSPVQGEPKLIASDQPIGGRCGGSAAVLSRSTGGDVIITTAQDSLGRSSVAETIVTGTG